MKPIMDVAAAFGIAEEYVELYGRYKGKLSLSLLEDMKDRTNGKLVLVTAMNPTPSGEGKTLTTIGLSQALNAIGIRAIAALREPSLGPCFGMKGGATGDNMAKLLPSEDINLHFTGDLHAITSAHNLLAAMIDNHLFHGNALRLNPSKILWKRVMDMNDRSLRQIVVGIGDGNGGVRESGFMITTASEVMAVLCLSENAQDLKERLGRMVVAHNMEGEHITAAQIGAVDAMTVLLKEALKPNMVQTVEGTPAIVHGGPFANIAHGCSSVIGTKTALKLADVVVTEAGFGADLGAEKFFDIKCRQAGLQPAAVVLVVTIKALKYNGGIVKTELEKPNAEALAIGIKNMKQHLENLRKFGVPAIVAINRFATDAAEEIDQVKAACAQMGVQAETSEVWAKGSAGGKDLALTLQGVLEQNKSDYAPLYSSDCGIRSKIEHIVTEIYRGDGIKLNARSEARIAELEQQGFGHLSVCMAKTPYSFSDQASLLGAPTGFTIQIKDITLSAGAGFIVVHTGNVLTMPGLPKAPAALSIRLDEEGAVEGLL